MGSFITNFQVRSESSDAVLKAMTPLCKARAYVSPPGNGWVTVFDEKCDEQDDAVIRKVATGLTKKLKTSVIAFLVHDSDVLCYWLYRDGKKIDEYNSIPDYFGEADEEAIEALRGNPEALAACSAASATAADFAKLLDPESQGAFAELTLIELAKLLGIDEHRVSVGFNYFDQGEHGLEDADQFLPIGADAGPKKPVRKAKSVVVAPRQLTPAEQQSEMFVGSVGMLFQMPALMRQIAKAQQLGVSVAGALGSLAPASVKQFDDKKKMEKMTRKVMTQYRNQVKTILIASNLADRPDDDQLLAAADEGPVVLAKFVALHCSKYLDGIFWSVAVGTDNLEPVRALLDCGASPNAQIMGHTVLTRAVFARNVEVVRLLIERGADVDKKGADGQTPMAIMKLAIPPSRPGDSEIIDILRAAGAKDA